VFMRIVLLLPMMLLLGCQSVYAQSGQNLPDILPYNSLHLFDSGESYQLADRDGDSFRNEVLANKGVSVVEFMLPTCLACNPTQTELDTVLSKYKGRLHYLRLHLNNNLKLSYKYDVPKVPTILVFNHGQLVKKFSVYTSDQKTQLARAIESQLVSPTQALARTPQPSQY